MSRSNNATAKASEAQHRKTPAGIALDMFQAFARNHPIRTAAIPILIALAAQAALKRQSEWLDVYVSAARIFLHGQDYYAAGVGYLYPPFQAILAIPFVPLPNLAARTLWYAVNVAAAVCMLRSSWRMAGGPELRGVSQTDRREWIALSIGLLCCGFYVLNAFAHQQSDVVIAALAMTGCAGLLRGRKIGGPILIGLAAAFKGPPLLFAVYFLFRRQWSTAALIVAVALGVNLIPDLIYSAPGGGTWLEHWLRDYVLPTQYLHTALGTWGSELIYNQSLGGTLQRLVNTKLQWTIHNHLEVEKLTSSDTIALKSIACGAMLVMLLVSIGAALRGIRVATNAERPYGLPTQTAIEFGVVFILALMISPMSGMAHFGVLALPAFSLSRIAVLAERRDIWLMILLAAIGGLIANKDLVGGTVYTALLWAGAVTWSAVALWIGSIIALARNYGEPALPAFARSLFVARDHAVNAQ